MQAAELKHASSRTSMQAAELKHASSKTEVCKLQNQQHRVHAAKSTKGAQMSRSVACMLACN